MWKVPIRIIFLPLVLLLSVAVPELHPQRIVVRGSLQSTDSIANGRPYDTFQVPAAIGQSIRVELEAAEFAGALVVIGPSGDFSVHGASAVGASFDTYTRSWGSGFWTIVVTTQEQPERAPPLAYVLHVAGASEVKEQHDARARAYARAAYVLDRLDKTHANAAWLDSSAVKAARVPAWPVAVHLMNKSADMFRAVGDRLAAVAGYRRVAEWARARGWGEREGYALLDVAVDSRGLGIYDSALVYSRSAAQRLESIHDSAGAAFAHNEAAFAGGHARMRHDSITGHYERALQLRPSPFLRMHILRNLAGRIPINYPDSALNLYREALRLTIQHADTPGLAHVYSKMGSMFTWAALDQKAEARRYLDSAIVYLRKAEAVYQTRPPSAALGDVYAELGDTYLRLEQYDSAVAQHQRTLRLRTVLEDTAGIWRSKWRIGVAFSRAAKPDSALWYFRANGDFSFRKHIDVGAARAASTEPRTVVDPDSVIAERRLNLARTDSISQHYMPYTYMALGESFTEKGQLDSAVFYLQKRVEVLKRRKDLKGLPPALRDLGRAYRDGGKLDAALTHYATALKAAQALQDAEEHEANILFDIGITQFDLARYDSAFTYMRRALALEKAFVLRQSVSGMHGVLAQLYEQRGQLDSAAVHYKFALAIAFEGFLPQQSVILGQVGGLHTKQEQLDSAMLYLNASLGIAELDNLPTVQASALSRIAEVQLKRGQPDSALANRQRALQIWKQQGLVSNIADELARIGSLHLREFAAYDRAAAHYDTAAALLAGVRADAGSEANRISFAAASVSVFQNWTKSLIAQGADAAALAANERGRTQALLDLMRGTRRVAPGENLAAEGAALMAGLRAGRTAALSYVVTPDTLYAFVVNASTPLEVYKVAVADTTLARRVAELRHGLDVDSAALRDVGAEMETYEGPRIAGRSSGGGFEQARRRLRDYLIPDALLARLSPDTDIAIVADGPLTLLPFAALPAGDVPFGIRYRLRYAPSITALLEAEARPIHAAASAPLVVGNPRMPAVFTAQGAIRQLSALPGAEAEARAVASKLNVELLTGPLATESHVSNRMRNATLIHLATHGYAYGTEARSRDSFVALAPTTQDDGLLTVGEVLDAPTRLRADLVVLSACQTGLGDQKAAEGTVGLQRAFLAKGARSVLVSLWSVNDAVTNQLMQSFYTQWLGGVSKSEALRRAQQEIRRRHPNPRYWSAFQLVGAN